MQLTQGLRRSQLCHGSRDATIFGDRRTDWNTLAERVARLAGGLLACWAGQGARIAILALNSDRYIEAYYAIMWAGCVAVPFNTRWAAAELDFAVQDSAPAMIILDAAFTRHAEAFAASGIGVIWMEPGIGPVSFPQLADTYAPIADRCSADDDIAAIFYTGGTTGRPKGVMLSHTNLIMNFMAFQAVAPYEPHTVFLHTAPMFHIADAFGMFGLTALGATHVVLPGFEPVATIKAIEQHRINALFLVPTMITTLCEALAATTADMSSVRRLTYGASPISSALLERAMAALPNAKFCQAYGQTELSPCATVLDHADHLAGHLRSAGRPLPYVEVRVVDPAMNDVAPGSVGEIVARGPGVMRGYWNDPDLTAKAIVGGWLRTGDAGRFDTEGYLYLEDRVKDMIISGGENIFSIEVENALLRHPDVLQCVVIGIPDPHWGEAVHAILHVRPGSVATEAEFVAHCEPLIARYKRPRSFELRQDPLPLSGAGKILKAELRKPFWSEVSRNVG